MSTPEELLGKAFDHVSMINRKIAPMRIADVDRQSMATLLAAEIIAEAIKEAAQAKPEPLTIHLSQEGSREEIAEKLRNQLGKADL